MGKARDEYGVGLVGSARVSRCVSVYLMTAGSSMIFTWSEVLISIANTRLRRYAFMPCGYMSWRRAAVPGIEPLSQDHIPKIFSCCAWRE